MGLPLSTTEENAIELGGVTVSNKTVKILGISIALIAIFLILKNLK